MKNDEKWWKMMKNDEKWWKMMKNEIMRNISRVSANLCDFFSPLDCTTKINRFGPGETWNCSIGSQKVTFFHSKSCKIGAKSVQNSCKNVISRFSGSCACHGPHHHSLLARLHHHDLFSFHSGMFSFGALWDVLSRFESFWVVLSRYGRQLRSNPKNNPTIVLTIEKWILENWKISTRTLKIWSKITWRLPDLDRNHVIFLFPWSGFKFSSSKTCLLVE